MAASSRLKTVQEMYDKRAPTYDQEKGFHPRQAADYLKWMSLQPGYKVLDLACGTGGIAIPAARVVGESGIVIGVDISPISLSIAKSKAERENLNVKFLLHDIGSLQGLEEEGIKENTFDVITCAAALVLLEDPFSAVKNWARLLKRGGIIISDAPTDDSFVKGLILEKVAQALQLPVVFQRVHLDSADKVRKLLTDAGLDSSGSFSTETYDETPEILEVGKAGEIFDQLTAENKWSSAWYQDLAKPEIREKGRELFCKELAIRANGKGEVKSWLKLYMALGRKN